MDSAGKVVTDLMAVEVDEPNEIRLKQIAVASGGANDSGCTWESELYGLGDDGCVYAYNHASPGYRKHQGWYKLNMSVVTNEK